MQVHKIGDTLLIHKIKPLPEGWIDRTAPHVGNRYTNLPMWNVYKDFEKQTYFEGKENPIGNRYTEGHTGIENAGMYYDGWKKLGMDLANTPDSLLSFSDVYACVFSKSGHLTYILAGYDNANLKHYYIIYRSKEVVVNEETDYGYMYDNLNTPDGLTIDDFTFEVITQSVTSTSSRQFMRFYDLSGILNFGEMLGTQKVTTWYADDRNGTNEQWKNQTVYYRYNFENGSLYEVKYEHFLAPRSLNKTPSSDPWAAQFNYIFDINNVDEFRLFRSTDSEQIDCHTMRPYFRCHMKAKEFYTVGFPEVPAFNYRDFEFYMCYDGKPIPSFYNNGGLTPGFRLIDDINNNAIFNNILISSKNGLSGSYSGINGVEIILPDEDFKTTQTIDDIHIAYDYGKSLYNIQRYYFSNAEQNMSGQYNDSNVNSITMHYFHRKDMSFPVAIPHLHYENTSYLSQRPFTLSVSGGFQFVGDDTFLNNLKQYMNVQDGYHYEFISRGYEYLYGGEVIQDLLLKAVQNGYSIPNIGRSSNYSASSPLYSGTDNEGYHVIASSVKRSGNYNAFLNNLMTEAVGNTTLSCYYRVSPDYSEVQRIGSRTPEDFDRNTISCINRYITKDWTNRPYYISNIMSVVYNPVKQKDTWTAPQLTPPDGDFRLITKATED